MYVSPAPDQHAWDIDALNINWSGLTAHAYPPMALLHGLIQKIRQCNCLIIVIAPGLPRDALVLGPSAALNRDPTLVTSVNNTSQTVPQPSVSQQSTTSEPPRLVSNVWWTTPRTRLLCGSGSENCCSSNVINNDHLQVKVGPIWEILQRKFGGFLHSLCETSLRPFHLPVPRSKQAPFDHLSLQDGHW